MPMHAHNKDEVFVGRIRRDESQPKTLNLWIVADNLRKGAATNAVQIAEYLLKTTCFRILLKNNSQFVFLLFFFYFRILDCFEKSNQLTLF